MRSGVDQAGTNLQRSQGSRQLSDLMARVAEKDSASLKMLYDRTSAKLYGICLTVLGDEAEAQDTLQEVYLKVWTNAASFDDRRSSPITWLATIARNRCIDRLRARRSGADDLDAALEVPDDGPSSYDVLEQAEDASRLMQCLEELEERVRLMIHAAFFKGATYPQLAAAEGVPLPTMKSWIRRGLIRLRGCLER